MNRVMPDNELDIGPSDVGIAICPSRELNVPYIGMRSEEGLKPYNPHQFDGARIDLPVDTSETLGRLRMTGECVPADISPNS